MDKQHLIASKLMSYKKVVLAGHTNPDGDAIGACLALANALKQYGADVVVLLEPFSSKYDFINRNDFIRQSIDNNYKFDVFVALDCASKDRLGIFCEIFDRAPSTINIDHHKSNTNFAQFNFVDGDASATCEILFDILASNFLIDSDIASALLCGILYDTGGFCHETTSIKTFHIVGELQKCNIEYSRIYRALISSHSLAEARLLAVAIGNIEEFNAGSIVASTLSIDEINSANGSVHSVDSIVGYLKNIKGVKVSVFLYEKALNVVKISFRSEDNIDVSHIAGLLGGGGHKYASGATFNGSLLLAKQKALEVLRSNI